MPCAPPGACNVQRQRLGVDFGSAPAVVGTRFERLESDIDQAQIVEVLGFAEAIEREREHADHLLVGERGDYERGHYLPMR